MCREERKRAKEARAAYLAGHKQTTLEAFFGQRKKVAPVAAQKPAARAFACIRPNPVSASHLFCHVEIISTLSSLIKPEQVYILIHLFRDPKISGQKCVRACRTTEAPSYPPRKIHSLHSAQLRTTVTGKVWQKE